MANVYVEPRPKSRDEGAAITGYVVESGAGSPLAGPYRTQEEAIRGKPVASGLCRAVS